MLTDLRVSDTGSDKLAKCTEQEHFNVAQHGWSASGALRVQRSCSEPLVGRVLQDGVDDENQCRTNTPPKGRGSIGFEDVLDRLKETELLDGLRIFAPGDIGRGGLFAP